MSALTAASPDPQGRHRPTHRRADGALRGREDGEGRRRRFTGGVRERRRGPRPRITLRLKTHGGSIECWVLETHDAVAHVFRCNQEGADADVAASMEMSLATFLRLAARRLKTSRAVLAGQCKASGTAGP